MNAGARTATGDLHHDIGSRLGPREAPLYREGYGHSRIEVRAAHRPQQSNECRQHCHGCPGIREQRNGSVPAR